MSKPYIRDKKFTSAHLKTNNFNRHSDLDKDGCWPEILDHIIASNNIGTDPMIDEDGYITSEWKPSDTKLAFENNLDNPHRRARLIKHGWFDEETEKPTPLEYRLNSNFFRCNHFENKPSVVSLGCSYTYGVGLTSEDTWSFKLANQLNLENYNLGCPGRSVALSAIYFMENFEKYFSNCQVLAALMPPANRVELVVSDEHTEELYVTGLFNQTALDQLYGPTAFGKEIVDSVYLTSYFYDRIVLKMLESLTNLHGIKFLVGRADDISDNGGSFARDLMHHGRPWQDDVFNYFKNLL